MGSSRIWLEIATRRPFADGVGFGETGPYEILAGRVRYAIDPSATSNRGVVDLEYAPRNADGLVECSADLRILKPVEMSRGNGRLLYDVNNRGNMRTLQFFNDAVHSNDPSGEEHAGNGFLMRRGYALVWSGWQGDLLPGAGRLTMDVPVATDHGKEITGPVRTEFTADQPSMASIPLSANSYTHSYDTVSLDPDLATLTLKEYEGNDRQPIPSNRWQFATLDEQGSPQRSSAHLYLPEGFRPGWIYELVYTARNPLVLGLGFTGVRDLVSFLVNNEVDSADNANPLRDGASGIEKAYSWGRSLSGRFLREFVYLGFNADTQGRQVFDAISPHVSGGGRVALNQRFAQPGRVPLQHRDRLFPSDQFPFAYEVTTDPLTSKTDGILKRPDTDPLVIHTQTSCEYWDRRGSLVHSDPFGNDLPGHQTARVYLFSSSQHFADPLKGPEEGAPSDSTAGPVSSSHANLSNPLNTTPLLRALLDALDAWATHGTPPPPSRVPRRSEETAVPAAAAKTRFPKTPGIVFPDHPNRLFVQDFGPEFDAGIQSVEPPTEDHTREYTVLIPQVDADGNDVPGIRTPDVDVPVATYTGWNFRPGNRALTGVVGSYFPFAATTDERERNGDPRPSLEERYASKTVYVDALRSAAEALVDQRLLLREDADRYMELAQQHAPSASADVSENPLP